MIHEQLIKNLIRLADAMYYAAQHMTTDASQLHKAMEDYHQFVINNLETTTMEDKILICDCASAEHQMVLRFDDDKDLGRQVFVEIHLVPLVWYKRLWLGLKYIFGYKCCYGNFEEMILSQKHARQIYNLYRFLNKPNLTKGQQDDSNND